MILAPALPDVINSLTDEVPIWLIHSELPNYTNSKSQYCRRDTKTYMVFNPDESLEYGYIACCDSIEAAIQVCKLHTTTYEIIKW